MKVQKADGLRELIMTPFKKRRFRLGLHQSDISFCLRKPFFQKASPEHEDGTAVMFMAGRGHHSLLEEAVLKETIGINEHSIERDGIWVTPDVILGPVPEVGAKGNEPIEIKSTRKSSRKSIEEERYWIRQLIAECKVTDSTVGFLAILYLMGDYQRPTKPELHAYRFEFTQNEIDEWWQLLLANKATYEKYLEKGEPVPVEEAIMYTWECGYCDIRNLCTEWEIKIHGRIPELPS